MPQKQDHGVLKICGRDAAVDYSITKEKYNAMQQGAPGAPPTAAAAAENDDDVEDEDEDGDGGEGGGGEGDGDGMDVDSDEEDGSSGDDDDSDDDEDEGARQREGGPDAAAGVGRTPERQQQQQRAPDVNHGCTVFVRNVAFDSAQEEIKDRFSEFGDVRLALLVKDRATGMPRGTAFVKVRPGRPAGRGGGGGAR